jgi:crotonobetainyl-CoA:carnitine CoA-transferase CaiB-like acyl-CoA transferase
MHGPLKGIRIIDIGTLIAAPFAARLMAEFGAEVIKIEAPCEGDPIPKWRKLHKDTSLLWCLQSRNKKSIAIHRKSPQRVDIVIENFKPGALEKPGLGWDMLHELNPKLTMVRISGYGQTGPYKGRQHLHRRPGEHVRGDGHSNRDRSRPAARRGARLAGAVRTRRARPACQGGPQP